MHMVENDIVHISGLAVKQLEDDRLENDRLRAQVIQDERKIKQLENILQERDNEVSRLKVVSTFFSFIQSDHEHTDVYCCYFNRISCCSFLP